MDYIQWYALPDTEKCSVWKRMTSGQLDIAGSKWSYCLARATEEQCEAFQAWVAVRAKATRDTRCTHPLLELFELVQDIREGCQVIRQYAATQEMRTLYMPQHRIKPQGQHLFRCLVRPLASRSYHAWRVCRAWLGMPGETGNVRWDNLSGWERVCEDEETEVWSHPALPHPADFLYKTKTTPTSPRYADKARFQYQFPNTLCRYSVVLTRTPSLIPKLATATPPTTISVPINSDKSAIKPSLYRESTRGHRTNRRQKKRAFSRIWKEQRKSKKRAWRVAKVKEETYDGYEEDGYEEDDDRYFLSKYYKKTKQYYTQADDGWTRVGHWYCLRRRKH